MAGASLLTLLDDIATVLDDVAILSKVAVKKTAGVLGDDLALNAEQVAGVKAEREIPVIMAVAKGSFKNKFILVPAALLISAFIPWLITPLLMIGGAYLCYEGAEKVWHALQEAKQDNSFEQRVEALAATDITDNQALEALENEKIKGAIRTDFILSAEIIVIALGTVQHASINTQIMVVSLIAVMITFVVYGLVALIVKMDDAGLHLLKKQGESSTVKIQKMIGSALLSFAPKLMKSLTYIGTVAMFLVGGGIIVHGVPILGSFSHIFEGVSFAGDNLNPIIQWLLPTLFAGLVGIGLGAILVGFHGVYDKLRAKSIAE
jgi:predicted DNA repair protein MutK